MTLVEELVKEFSPLVWLAPGERFLPMSVDEFLKNVHPELPDSSIKPIYDLNDDPDKYVEYYSKLKELEELKTSIYTNRIKRNYKNLGSESTTLLPTGNLSEKWYLVTKTPIEALKKNKDSFIYGKDPNKDSGVPIYAVVTLCEDPDSSLENHVYESKKDKTTTKNRYIPVSLPRSLDINAPVHVVMAETVTPVVIAKDKINNKNDSLVELNNTNEVVESQNSSNDVTTEKWMNEGTKSDWRPTNINTVINFNKKKSLNKPITSFFVDYWMFYPYSAGKIMCSIDLGPLGPIPIPLVFGFCLGTKKEFG